MQNCHKTDLILYAIRMILVAERATTLRAMYSKVPSDLLDDGDEMCSISPFCVHVKFQFFKTTGKSSKLSNVICSFECSTLLPIAQAVYAKYVIIKNISPCTNMNTGHLRTLSWNSF